MSQAKRTAVRRLGKSVDGSYDLGPSVGFYTVTRAKIGARVESRSYPPPTVIKYDVEGAELRVLQGARRGGD